MEELKQWLEENYPTLLAVWEESFVELIDLGIWIEEYCGWVDQEYQAYLEGED